MSSICTTRGCPRFAERRGKCLEHAREGQKTYDDSRRESRPFYWSPAWRRLRAKVMREEPFCRLCTAAGRVALTEEVDHIVPIKEGGAPLDRKNCQGLCKPCHLAKTRREEAERRKAAGNLQ